VLSSARDVEDYEWFPEKEGEDAGHILDPKTAPEKRDPKKTKKAASLRELPLKYHDSKGSQRTIEVY